MGSLSNSFIERELVCLDVHTVRVRVQCSAWAAYAMHLLYVGTCT